METTQQRYFYCRLKEGVGDAVKDVGGVVVEVWASSLP